MVLLVGTVSLQEINNSYANEAKDEKYHESVIRFTGDNITKRGLEKFLSWVDDAGIPSRFLTRDDFFAL